MGVVGYGGEVGMKVLLKIVCGTAMFFAVLFAAKGFMNGNVAMGVGALAAVWASHWIGFKGTSGSSAVQPLAAFQPPAPSGEAEISRMVDAALENGDYSPEEERAISARAAQLQIRGDGEGGRKMWQAAYYRDLLAGRPRECPVPWPAGFVSEPNERLIWAWDAEVLVWKTDKAYVGSTAGVSFRVAKGVTVRTGGVKGHVEKIEGFASLGVGKVAVTNKALLISCGGTSMRIGHRRLVHVQLYSDGVAVQHSGGGKPMIVKTGWNDTFFGITLLNARRIR